MSQEHVAQIVITFDAKSNHLHVEGPIQNIMLAYAMLERAKDVIREQAQPRVVPAATVPNLSVVGH